MAKLFGIAEIHVPGIGKLRSKPGAKVNLGGVTRKPVISGQVDGFVEEPVAPFIECEISMKAGTELSGFKKMTDETIQFHCDTGQKYALLHAWCENPPELKSGAGGEIPLKFVGLDCTEVVS